tara:strand:+ start:1085 stop:1870 length:786 start_codon:yes stop_codon:yes gene_type:complete
MFNKKYKNVFFNILKNRDFSIIVKKIKNKFESNTSVDAANWAKENKTDLEVFCKSKDAKLWRESLIELDKIEKNILSRLQKIPNRYNGIWSNLKLVYFLMRYYKPKKIIETGVAAGTSSEAILQAINKNNKGYLYSSDLPYYKIEQSEKFIGAAVSDELKKFWKLDIRGDHYALDDFINLSSKIDFFYYDSDKSYNGRNFAMKKVNKHFSLNAVLIMDDIQDNLFFKNFVEKENLNFKVFGFKNQFVGLVENIGLQLKKKA